MQNNPAQILIIHTAFLGDIILSLPLIEELAKIFPASHIDYLTIPPSVNILETHPALRRVISYDKHGSQGNLSGGRHLIRQLRQTGYQLAIIPHRSLRSAIIPFLARIPRRIGFDASAAHFLMTDKVIRDAALHEIEKNLQLLEPLGYQKTERVLPRLFFSDGDRRKVEQIVSEFSSPFVAMAPGSVWATKRWLPERFAEVADNLANKGYAVILIGGPADGVIAEQVTKAAQSSLVNLVGKLSLRESALLISHCRLLLTNDSAPLHMGVGVKTPVVAIFGPTVRDFGFYPYGINDLVVEIADLPCRPCGKHGGQHCPEGHFNCMRHINATRVTESIEKRLAKQA